MSTAIAVLAALFALSGRVAADPDSESVGKVYQRLLPALVEVKVWVIEDRATPPPEQSPLDRHFDRYVRQRVPIRMAGLRVTPEGDVLIRDPNLPLHRYGRIEMTDAQGIASPACVKAVLENHAGILVGPMIRPIQPAPHVVFAEAKVAPGDPLFMAHPTFLEKMLSLRVEKIFAAATVIAENPPTEIHWWEETGELLARQGQPPYAPPIVLNAAAEVMGVALDSAIWSTAAGDDSWIGRAILADKRLAQSDLDRIAGVVRAKAAGAVKEIEIQFRKDSPLAQEVLSETGKLYVYGVLMDGEGRLFVPAGLDRDEIRQIDGISVLHEGKAIPAVFEGLYRDMGVFVVKAKGLTGTPAVALDGAELPRGKTFYTLSVRRRYGARFDDVQYNRYLDVVTGYGEAQYPIPMKPLRVGDLIADVEGRLLGFYAPLRREEQDDIRARTGGLAGEGEMPSRVYLFSEVAAVIRNPEGHYDLAARPMSRKEEGAIVWLGVEYQPMNAPLARAFKADGVSRGGARGILVTEVYPGSPAERLKIGPGHILLAIDVPGAAAEIDLVQPSGRAWGRREKSEPAGPRLWASRRNYLTAVLTLLGEGRQVRLRVFRNDREDLLPVTLERAPEDYDTADEYRDQVLGLSVRQATYEVRLALRLAPDAPGVVVSAVEPGGRASVANIAPYELITRVGGRPVRTPQEFQALVQEAMGGEKVEFLVQNLGQTRIAEIDLTPEMF